MFKILKQEEYSIYEEFAKQHNKGHFMQSIDWYKIKNEWIGKVVVVYDNDKIVGGISVLVRKLPYFNMSIMYAPRGPVCDIYDEKVLTELVQGIKQLAKENHSFIFRMDPDIKNSDNKFKELAKKIGFKIKDDIKRFGDGIQPRYVFRLDIKDKDEETLLKSFHEKTRYNIRLSTRKGVTVKEGTRNDLKKFHEIMEETGERDAFGIRPLSYFENMYDILHDKNNMKLLMAYYEDKPIAGVIEIIYGNKAWYLYGASSSIYRNVMPNYALQWEMIKIAKQNNCDIYDFRGVEEFEDESKPEYGVYKFKKGFNGEFIEFIGEIQLVFHPFINFCFEKGLHFFKVIKFRNIKR